MTDPPAPVAASAGASRAPVDALGYAEAYVPEDAALLGARVRAGEVGLLPVPPLVGATLRLLAAVTGAHAVAEVGTGTGVSALWLLRGMRSDGVLTTVDTEGEHHRLARAALAEAEVASGRTRLITGRAQEVLPRLAERAYDLVHVDVPLESALDLLGEAVRVLRPGGVLAVSGALAGGRVPDGAARDAEAVAGRALAKAVREEERLTPLLLPIGAGLLVAARTSAPAAG